MLQTDHNQRWSEKLHSMMDVNTIETFTAHGRLVRMVGLTLEAEGCHAAIGDRCRVVNDDGSAIEAEVVGFSGDNLYLMPTGQAHGLSPNARVIPLDTNGEIRVGPQLLGRIINAEGKPLDALGSLNCKDSIPLKSKPLNPLERAMINQPLDVGIRSINSMLSVGRGQRMGLFASSGMGKSVLLGMMTRFTDADIIVVGLIGERGREVNEFIKENLSEEDLKRSVVVVSPADDPPLMRLNGALLATSIAEYFRDQGNNVLLLMDSLTRFAQAQREISLTIGEPPATRGYPPSVFARLPEIVERAGNGKEGEGSITAFYTVLTEVDQENDPIAEAARAILDGHIILSSRLVEAGVYPAIDMEMSISRAMNQIIDSEHLKIVQTLKSIYSIYMENKDLISVGAYQSGASPEIDAAIALYPEIVKFLKQDKDTSMSYQESLEQLKKLSVIANRNVKTLENNSKQ